MDNSSFNLELETKRLFAEVTSILFSVGIDLEVLEGRIKLLKDKVGEQSFKEIVEELSDNERKLMKEHCDNLIKSIIRVKETLNKD